MELEHTQTRNILVKHNSDWKIDQVLINGKDLFTLIEDPLNWEFDPFSPDIAGITFRDEFKQVLEDMFFAIDDLYSTHKECLAAFLSSFLYERLTPSWKKLILSGNHINAIQYWKKYILITQEWEGRNNKHIHKGTPYAFMAYTYLLIGDIDTGFSYIYNAIEEDIRLNSVCPQLNYPRSAPVYLTASLSSVKRNVMYSFVERIRLDLETNLSDYRDYFGGILTLSEFDNKFLQNELLDIIKYYFVFTYWTVFEYQRKVDAAMMQNDFSKLKNANWMFALCLVIDKLLNRKYGTDNIGKGIIALSTDKGYMRQSDLENLRSQNNLNKDPDDAIPRLLQMNLNYNGSPIKKEIQYLLVAWNIRNFAGHNIKIQNVFGDKFKELFKVLLYCIFIIVEEY